MFGCADSPIRYRFLIQHHPSKLIDTREDRFNVPSAPLIPNIMPHFQALFNFIRHTLPKPVLFALLYRLSILQMASRILPTIGADSFDDTYGVDDTWEDRPVRPLLSLWKQSLIILQTSALTRLLLTYRQSIFVTVYSHLLREWARFSQTSIFSSSVSQSLTLHRKCGQDGC